MPLFSVIIPTYNRASFLKEAIESVLMQSFRDWELVIVDDGSTDDTRVVCNAFDDDRIKYVFQKNAERSAARNNGIKNANGKFICFLDDDDFYHKDHLDSFNKVIEKNPTNQVFITGLKIDNKIEFNYPNQDCKQVIWKHGASPMLVCIDSILAKKTKFDSSYVPQEDFFWLIRILQNHQIISTEKTTCSLRFHENRSTFSTQLEVLNKQFKNISSMYQYMKMKKFYDFPFISAKSFKVRVANQYWGYIKKYKSIGENETAKVIQKELFDFYDLSLVQKLEVKLKSFFKS